MPEPTNPEYRLRNLLRKVRDLLMGRRLSADPEATGVVDLSDFGKRSTAVADFAAASVADLALARGPEAETARRLAEELELAARLAARLEAAPDRIARQCDVLEEAARAMEAALRAECVLEEPPVTVSPAAVARQEKRLFEPLVEFAGTIEDAPPALLDRGKVRRELRRALLGHGAGPFRLDVTRAGEIRFGDRAFAGEAAAPGVPRGPGEPPEVKRALDLREASRDEALRDFLLVKAVDEALCAVLAPRLQGTDLPERARALPTGPGKRAPVRAEAVARPVPGWSAEEAARAAEKLAARRAGPEWARIPKGAYLLRLFLSDDDALAADLLLLGPMLRRMEKGEAAEGAREAAERCLPKLLGLVG